MTYTGYEDVVGGAKYSRFDEANESDILLGSGESIAHAILGMVLVILF